MDKELFLGIADLQERLSDLCKAIIKDSEKADLVGHMKTEFKPGDLIKVKDSETDWVIRRVSSLTTNGCPICLTPKDDSRCYLWQYYEPITDSDLENLVFQQDKASKAEASLFESGSLVKVKDASMDGWAIRHLVSVEDDGSCICKTAAPGCDAETTKWDIWEPLTDEDIRKIFVKNESVETQKTLEAVDLLHTGLRPGDLVKVKAFDKDEWFFRRLVSIEPDGSCICKSVTLKSIVKYHIWESLSDSDVAKLTFKEK